MQTSERLKLTMYLVMYLQKTERLKLIGVNGLKDALQHKMWLPVTLTRIQPFKLPL